MKMNKILAALSVMAIALASCQQEPVPVDPGAADEGQVAVDMTVTLPGAGLQTKALGSDPVIRNIYVAVFGMNKYLNEFVKAVPLDGSGHIAPAYTPYDDNSDGIADKYRVRVILSRNATTRYVHVVANVDEAHIPDFGYENEFMDALTSDEGDGYWQYMEFPEADGGIFHAAPGDPNYAKSASARLANVTLIRDFAWIDVQVGTAVSSSWDFEAYEVYNTPDKGYYPIVTAISGSDYTFSTDYVSNTFEENISSYSGRLSPGATLQPAGGTFPANIPTAFAAGAGTGSKFVYENLESGTSTSTFIVIRLKKRSDDSIKYFRIDLANASGYIPVLRNYHYTVNISGIGVEGAATPREAATTRSKSNAFTGVDISRLSELNDGISTLRVGYTEKVFCSPVTGTEFLYRYTPDMKASTTYGTATLSAPSGASIISNRSADWATGGTAEGSEGWQKVTFDIAAGAIPASGQQSSTFKVTGKNTTTGTSITQTITIITMPKQDFIASTPSGSDLSGSESLISDTGHGKLYLDVDTYKLFFKLPDDLPRSLFPLTLIFDQPGNKIAPARPGTLVEIDETTSTIKYAKEVTLAAYEASKEVQFWFKATQSISSGDKLKVRDRNKTYFNEVEVNLQ